jgi:hypothetical protein
MEVSVFYGGICVLWTTFSLMLTRNGGICVLWTHSLFIYRTCSYYLQTEGFLKLKKGSAIYLVWTQISPVNIKLKVIPGTEDSTYCHNIRKQKLEHENHKKRHFSICARGITLQLY